MKKLMMTIALACAASFAQAATCTWGTNVNYWNGAGESASDTSGTKLGKDKVTGYLYYFASAQAFNDALTTIEGQDEKTAKWAKDYIANNTAATSATTGKSGSLSLDDGNDYSGQTLYGVLIAKTTQGGTDYYYASAAQYAMGTADATISDLNVTVGGSASSSSTPVTWNAVESVPEPFSGALALLGMGAIALRRKMKKAKKA